MATKKRPRGKGGKFLSNRAIAARRAAKKRASKKRTTKKRTARRAPARKKTTRRAPAKRAARKTTRKRTSAKRTTTRKGSTVAKKRSYRSRARRASGKVLSSQKFQFVVTSAGGFGAAQVVAARVLPAQYRGNPIARIGSKGATAIAFATIGKKFMGSRLATAAAAGAGTAAVLDLVNMAAGGRIPGLSGGLGAVIDESDFNDIFGMSFDQFAALPASDQDQAMGSVLNYAEAV